MVRSAPRPRKGTKTQRLAAKRLQRLVVDLYDDRLPSEVEWTIPEAWATLEDDIDVEEKRVKISLRLDESVVKFYRAMGEGYQARMNRVLATYAQMKIAEVRWHEASIDDLRFRTLNESLGIDKGG